VKKQQKKPKKQKLLPASLKKGNLKGEKATKTARKAKNVAKAQDESTG
jgi:hypothetical protein